MTFGDAAEGAQNGLRLGEFDQPSGGLDRRRVGAMVGALNQVARPAKDQQGERRRYQRRRGEPPVEHEHQRDHGDRRDEAGHERPKQMGRHAHYVDHALAGQPAHPADPVGLEPAERQLGDMIAQPDEQTARQGHRRDVADHLGTKSDYGIHRQHAGHHGQPGPGGVRVLREQGAQHRHQQGETDPHQHGLGDQARQVPAHQAAGFAGGDCKKGTDHWAAPSLDAGDSTGSTAWACSAAAQSRA